MGNGGLSCKVFRRDWSKTAQTHVHVPFPYLNTVNLNQATVTDTTHKMPIGIGVIHFDAFVAGRPFPSCLILPVSKRIFIQHYLSENLIPLRVDFSPNRTHFRKTDFLRTCLQAQANSGIAYFSRISHISKVTYRLQWSP